MSKTTIYKTVIVLLFMVIAQVAYCQTISSEQSFDHASEFLENINTQFDSNHQLYESWLLPLIDDNETFAYVFVLEPKGYIIVSAFETDTPIIGFSLENQFPQLSQLKNMPAFPIIKGISMAHKLSPNKQFKAKSSYKSVKDDIYGPWLSTVWGQVNCYDIDGILINVTNIFTPNHYAPGCVAISLSEVLHYYNWPPRGKGYHEYYDGLGSSTGWYDADFSETYYQWDLMLDRYYNQESTIPQREAAGELAFHAAVALDMNFEYNGSTSNVNKIPSTGANYFRFYSFYKAESNNIFWSRLNKNVMEANPIILAIENNSGGGHSIVCDGLWVSGDDRYYHLSMGWWGASDGWYTIQDNFNAGGYNSILGGVLDFIPVAYLDPVQMPNDTNMFYLTWQFTQAIEADEFEVQRKINSGSWETIAESYNDTALLVVIDNIDDNYYFRVKAMVNGEYYPSTWSNVGQLEIISSINENNLENHFEIFPNPFTDHLIISSLPDNLKDLRIYNINGTVMYERSESVLFDQFEIHTSQWNKGMYLVEANINNSRQVFKIVKE